MNKNDLCEKNNTRKVFKNEKLFFKLPIIWLGIFEINSRIILSQMIGNFEHCPGEILKNFCINHFYS